MVTPCHCRRRPTPNALREWASVVDNCGIPHFSVQVSLFHTELHLLKNVPLFRLMFCNNLALFADESRFATPGINVGLFCSTPAVPLSRNISQKRAFEMLTTGDFIDAQVRKHIDIV